MIDETAIRRRYEALPAGLDERGRFLFAAAEARAAGFGGVGAVARATGTARSTIDRGLRDLAAAVAAQKIRRAGGGGRPPLTRKDPTLLEDLRKLLEPATLGDPMRPLLWVSKSHAKLAAALRDMGHRVSASRIPQLLERLGYRRQVNRKSKEGGPHPDRDAQFEHINAQVEAHQAAGQPAISVDTKKKELIGEYKNAGSDYQPQGIPIDVNVHDFTDTRSSARPFSMASTISAPMPVASASASITTPLSSRSTPSGAGSRRWDTRDTHSDPTAAQEGTFSRCTNRGHFDGVLTAPLAHNNWFAMFASKLEVDMGCQTFDPSSLFWLPEPKCFTENLSSIPLTDSSARELRRLSSCRLNTSQLRRLNTTIADLRRTDLGRAQLSQFKSLKSVF